MRRYLPLIVLGVLVLVDAVLIALALRHTQAGSDVRVPQPTSSQSAGTAGSPGATGKTGTSPSPTTTSSTPAGKVIVVPLSSTRAWRASTGSTVTAADCRANGTPATIAYTRDGGTTWTPVQVPLQSVSAMGLVGPSMVATGLDSSCRPTTYSFSSSSVAQPVTQALPWAVAADSDATLQVAGVAAPRQPCSDGVADIAADSASYATVLCHDGAIRRTTDAGATWTKQADVAGALALATDATHNVYVVTRRGCGLTVSPADASTSSSGTACVTGSKDATGPLDLSISGGTQWLVTETTAWSTPLGG